MVKTNIERAQQKLQDQITTELKLFLCDRQWDVSNLMANIIHGIHKNKNKPMSQVIPFLVN